jgi:DNA topoisomerase-1
MPNKETKKKGTKAAKPRRASIPKEKDPASVGLEDALVYLSLPRVLGKHPSTGEDITASIGRFGPFIVHEKDFRSLKTDDVYTIELPRALEIFKEEKKKRGFAKKAK